MTGRLSPAPADRALAPRLTVALLAGPAAWMARLLISLALIPYACLAGEWMLHLLSLGFGLVAAAALVVSVKCRRAAVLDPAPESPRKDRNRFVALLAVAVNAASLLAIVLESIATVVIDPCMK